MWLVWCSGVRLVSRSPCWPRGLPGRCCRCALWCLGHSAAWSPGEGPGSWSRAGALGSPPGEAGGHAPGSLSGAVLLASPCPPQHWGFHTSPPLCCVFKPVPLETGFTLCVLCACCCVAHSPLSIGLSEPTRWTPSSAFTSRCQGWAVVRRRWPGRSGHVSVPRAGPS